MIPFQSHCKWDLYHMPSFLDSSQVYGHLGCVNQERNTFRRGMSKGQYRQWVSMVSGEMWCILAFELQGQIHRNFKFFVVHSEACTKWQDLCIFQVALKILESFSKENEIYIKVVLLPTFNDKVFSGLKVILRSSNEWWFGLILPCRKTKNKVKGMVVSTVTTDSGRIFTEKGEVIN